MSKNAEKQSGPAYLPRIVDAQISKKLEAIGAVNIIGCKWCGKTRTAKQFAKSVFELENPDNRAIVELAKSQTSLILEGERPRLIDEWQDMPEIWDAVRYAVDRANRPGQYLLTGSATPRKNRPRHSGAGRFSTIKMRPMSLFESGESTGEVSLAKLFEGEAPSCVAPELRFEELAYLCSRGGWPSSITQKPADPLLLPREYLNTILGRDESFANLDFYSPERMATLLRSLARNTSTPVRLTTIQKDIAENSDLPISDTTLSSYLATLEQIHLLDSVEAWSPKLRSKTEIRTTKKRFLVDPSLAVAALSASPEHLLSDIRTFGFIFESLVLRDLKTYASALDGDVSYYRDRSGRECDAIIHLWGGAWCAIEIKLGSDLETLDAAAASLLKFKEQIDTTHTSAPSFLMVVSGNARYAYRREDGVYVAPVATLGP